MFPRNHPFFQVPLTRQPTSSGEVDLPILYYDASAFFVFYLGDQARVRPYLQEAGLEPALTLRGKVLMGLACFAYRDSSIGAYNEVGLGVACRPRGSGSAGWGDMLKTLSRPDLRGTAMLVLNLPVTTEAACSAGREIWGLPKFTTAIDYRKHGREFSCSVHEPDLKGVILTLAGRHGIPFPMAAYQPTFFSMLGGQLLRTNVNASGRSHIASPGDISLSCGNSDHPLAQNIRNLGIEEIKPLAVLYTDQLQLRLNAGCVWKN